MNLTLPNGLRVVAELSDGNVTYMGALVNAGSRDDAIAGQAHFVEHTIFKGTAKRRSFQISDRMEIIGGELNAYTTKEEIMLYTTAPAGYEERAAELLADLFMRPTFPEEEIEREQGVILEEIESYRDNPSYAVFDDFDEKFYEGNGLAHNILGYPLTVRAITPQDAAAFVEQRFIPSQTVIYCLSPTDPQKCLRIIEKHFGALSRPGTPLQRTAPPEMPVFDETVPQGNNQANTVLGARIFSYHDPRMYPLFLLSNILGGPGMNSRLNRELREKRGLVYSVETSLATYSDCGAFMVFFGCGLRAVPQCVKVVRRELERLAADRLADRTFRQAQEQICGQLLVSGDYREGRAMALAKSWLRHGAPTDNRLTAERIRAVTADYLRDTAAFVASRPMSRLTLC